jgi:hypothetical protein
MFSIKRWVSVRQKVQNFFVVSTIDAVQFASYILKVLG